MVNWGTLYTDAESRIGLVRALSVAFNIKTQSFKILRVPRYSGFLFRNVA